MMNALFAPRTIYGSTVVLIISRFRPFVLAFFVIAMLVPDARLHAFEIPAQSQRALIGKTIHHSYAESWQRIIATAERKGALIVHAEKASGIMVVKYLHATTAAPIYVNILLTAGPIDGQTRLIFFAFASQRKAQLFADDFVASID